MRNIHSNLITRGHKRCVGTYQGGEMDGPGESKLPGSQ